MEMFGNFLSEGLKCERCNSWNAKIMITVKGKRHINIINVCLLSY